MGLLRKVRVLVRALVHKPFTARAEQAGGDEERPIADSGPGPDERPSWRRMARGQGGEKNVTATEAATEPADSSRVADLIARQREEQGH